MHEKKLHGVTVSKKQRKDKGKSKNELYLYMLLLFKLSLLHKNLDDAVDMADGARRLNQQSMNFPFTTLQTKRSMLLALSI